jgi:NAD(P)-dependent dehydrogenase (short-subunit alcohol dehydrogenase family)
VRGLAVDLKPLRVNFVAVGAVHTEMLDRAVRSQGGLLKTLESETTVGRLGRPEDVAEAYIYVMKDHFITGSTIGTNGGFLLV